MQSQSWIDRRIRLSSTETEIGGVEEFEEMITD